MWHNNKQLLLLIVAALIMVVLSETGRSHDLTACQHLRRAGMRRSKSLGVRVRTPRCNTIGQFEKVQCQNEKRGHNCWCVDEYGIEIPGTRSEDRTGVRCKEPENCPAASCRMFCPAGFARDPETGCIQCRCRDVCDGVQCPRGQACQLSEVKCKDEPCPPIATCKKARSLQNYCPAGMPLAIETNRNGSERPFLCGISPGKPQCPPLYKCIIESGNDYGVCCPKGLTFQKPGVCPKRETETYTDQTGYLCGMPCSHDLECGNMEKCCYTKGCQYNCQQPYNITACQQARALTDLMAISEREGRGYIPDCNGPNGMFSPRQCSRNGLVCWCVDPHTGHKISGTMGAAKMVNCDGWENMISRSMLRRSFDKEKCDKNICAAVCEYGFKTDQQNCPTCECSEPCEGYQCPNGTHCEVTVDPLCSFESSLCSSLPICKPNLLSYSNPCEMGVPLMDNITSELIHCNLEQSSAMEHKFSNGVLCPTTHKCIQLPNENRNVCCPTLQNDEGDAIESSTENHVQTMCEYLRDFSLRMEGTEEGMKLAIAPPRCTAEGQYHARQCTFRKIKVTRAEQRKILEENTIRRMRMLLTLNQSSSNNNNDRNKITRSRRNVESLKLYRVDDKLLKVQGASPVIGRSAKVIDMQPNRQQNLGQLFETNFKKVIPGAKRLLNDNEIVDLEVEECWCVDNFGTEIPRTRGFNVTDEMCHQLRESIGCLDLTCRMGCEYGFTLDPETRCPACQCRDPCQDVVCKEMEECRLVEVSCRDEYCPPVPACLPRKPGQCPYLVPPGPDNLDTNACSYECKTDAQCTGARRCCSNGCGTQCVLPQMKTACQHLQGIQMHQSSELGIPVMKMNIAQCNDQTGQWNQVQCAPDGSCWCVDRSGRELSGTRTKNSPPVCKENSAVKCRKQMCKSKCDTGYKMDQNGCPTCECHNFCDEISCSPSEECQLIEVECVDTPCPKMPICVPKRPSVCAEGSPLKLNDTEMSCGPHNGNDTCPTTHTCQLNPVTKRGVCCTKTRDVCFESVNNACLAKRTSLHNATLYRFSPRANRCVAITIDLDEPPCQTKNIFLDEISCNSVCPILTQCERLRLKNTLAAQRTGHSSVWFKPRCDPITGHWSPVQCLGKQPELLNKLNASVLVQSPAYGVCWCADKKGAPLKGTLTRDEEPTCSNRQSRHYAHQQLNANDILMEELIRQLTALIDDDNNSDYGMEVEENALSLTTIDDNEDGNNSIKPINLKTTRCRSLADTASFPVACDENGAFIPTQCNQEQCWCVDTAGNQLESLAMFDKGSYNCTPTPISTVIIELYLQNITSNTIRNIYDIVNRELQQLLGHGNVGNLRVQEYYDGSAVVHFELSGDDKIDVAFAIETMLLEDELKLIKGQYRSDITRSQFIHQRLDAVPIASRIISHEGTIQFVLFITASCSAFLICVLVIYFILKRRQQKGKTASHMFIQNCSTSTSSSTPPPPLTYLYDQYPSKINLNDEFNDFPSPIFVLSPEHDLESIRPSSIKANS